MLRDIGTKGPDAASATHPNFYFLKRKNNYKFPAFSALVQEQLHHLFLTLLISSPLGILCGHSFLASF